MSDEEKPGLWDAVKGTIVDSADTISEGIDLLGSAVSDGGVLDEVPMVSTGVKLLQVRDKWHLHRLKRNCHALMMACKNASHEARARLWQELAADREKTDDFVDTLFMVALESTKPLKAEMVGRLIAALASGDLMYAEYDALVHIVHTASISSLKGLQTFIERNEGYPDSHEHAFPEEPLLLAMGIASRYGSGFQISVLGQTLIRVGLGCTVKTGVRPDKRSDK